MLVESPRERSPHKRRLPTSTRSIRFCVTWVCISSSSSSSVFCSFDPFVEVYWNGDLVHNTAVVKGSLDPQWRKEAVTVREEAMALAGT
jgi:hypothetical protein